MEVWSGLEHKGGAGTGHWGGYPPPLSPQCRRLLGRSLSERGQTGLVDCCIGQPTPFDVNPVPGPIVGAGLPGLIVGCLALVGLARRRRKAAIA